MSGPEVVYDNLTSGNPGTLDTLELDLSRGMKVLAGAIDAIHLAKVASAEEYERTDDGAKGAFNNLQRFLARLG